MDNKDNKEKMADLETLLFSNQVTRTIPDADSKKVNGKPYIYYGVDNKFPQYLWKLYNKSAVLQSIINGTSDYVMGNEIQYSESISNLAEMANSDYDKLEDVIKKNSIDYLIFGGFAIQILRTRTGNIGEIYWLDMNRCRVNEDRTKLYYSEDWSKWSPDFIEYDIYDPKTGKGDVIYFRGHKTRSTYPVPIYIGALTSVEISTEISKFHLNAILNNFNVSAIINFNNGKPADPIREEMENKFNDKFCGSENASKFMLSFNNDKDHATEVIRLQGDDFDKKYEALTSNTMKDIFISFRATPALFGVNPENNGFSKQEFTESFELYNKTVVSPIQKDIARIYNNILGENAITFVPFSL